MELNKATHTNYGQNENAVFKAITCDGDLESHYSDVIMDTMASQITSVSIVAQMFVQAQT